MTDHELANLAVAALRRTTVSYPEWAKRVAAGRYNPRDGSLTEWGKAFGYLSQIKPPEPAGVALPNPPFTVRDGGGTTVSFPEAFVRTEDAVTIAGLHVKNVTGYGVGSMQFWPPTVEDTGYTTVRDCIAENVRQPQPGKMGGTGEACFWFGSRTRAQRIHAKGAGWMGAFVGAKCHDSTIEDFTVEACPVGVYFEHEAHDVLVRRLATRDIRDQAVAGGTEPGGVLAARSVSVEWWYRDPQYGNRLTGSHSLTFEDCDIFCPAGADPRCGVYVGPGTYGMRFLGCRFWGPGVAVRLPTVRANGGADAVFDGCTFENAGQRVVYHSLPMGT